MTGDRHAVLIGNTLYPDEPKLQDLRCPERDVDGLNDLLKARERGGFTTTTVLKDKPHYEVLLGINRALKQANKGDLVLIYYSGHGKLDLANRLYLCAVNTQIDTLEATSVPVQSIKDYIEVSPSQQIALVLDCCFSGAVGDVFARSSVDDQLQLMTRGRGTYIMTASTGIQVALEKEKDENSIFTKYLLEGIETGAADVNGDGLITMDELYSYVHHRVLEEGFQEPMRWGINVRGEMVVARTGKSPRQERRKKVRAKLLTLASEGLLPDRILSKAMDIIASDPRTMTDDARQRDALLDKLVDEKVGIGDFFEDWFSLELGRRLTPAERKRLSGGAERPPAEEPPATRREPPPPSPASAAATESPPPPTSKAPPHQPPGPTAVPKARLVPTGKPEPASKRVPKERGPAVPTSLLGPLAGSKQLFWRAFGFNLVGGILAFVLGAAVSTGFRDIVRGMDSLFGGRNESGAIFVLLLAGGTTVGLLQSFVLRPYVPRRGRWILASVLGWGLGGGFVGTHLGFATDNYLVLSITVALVGGATAGFLQSRILEDYTPHARRWVWISTFSWLSGAIVGAVAGPMLGQGSEGTVFAAAVVGSFTWLVITSAGFAWMFGEAAGQRRAAVSPAPDEPTAVGFTAVQVYRALGYGLLAWLSWAILVRAISGM